MPPDRSLVTSIFVSQTRTLAVLCVLFLQLCEQKTEDLLLPVKKIFTFGVGQALWEKVFFPSALRLWLHPAQLLLLYPLTEHLQPSPAPLLQSRCDQKGRTTLQTRSRTHAQAPCAQQHRKLPGGPGGGTAPGCTSVVTQSWAPPAPVPEPLLSGENGRAAEKGPGRQRHASCQRAKGKGPRGCPALGEKHSLCTGFSEAACDGPQGS